MKTLNLLLLALCAILFTSCAGVPPIRVPGGQIVFGGAGGNGGYQQQYRQMQQPPQSSRPWGQKVVTTQKFLTEEKRGVKAMRVQGQAPSAVCVQVRDAVGRWCEKIHSTHGTWPTFDEAAEKTRQEFSSRGYQLHLTQTVGENGGFTLEYPKFWEEIGKPVKSGEPVVTRSDILEQDVPASILARSRAGERGILMERGQEGQKP